MTTRPFQFAIVFAALLFASDLAAAQESPSDGSVAPESDQDEGAPDEMSARDRIEQAAVGIVLADGTVHAGVLVRPDRVLGAGHCLDGHQGEAVTVTFDDEEVTGIVVRVRRDLDVAVVAIDPEHSHVPVELADRGDTLPANGTVFFIGEPLGVGSVFSVGRFVGSRGDRLVLEARVFPGNSGGPVVGADCGRLHGLLVEGDNDGHAFAVPAEVLAAVLEDRAAPPAQVPGRRARRARPPATLPSTVRPEGLEVTLFGAEYCPACRATRRWLVNERIAFIELEAILQIRGMTIVRSAA